MCLLVDAAHVGVVDHLVWVIVHRGHLRISRSTLLPDVVLDGACMCALLTLSKLLLELLDQ